VELQAVNVGKASLKTLPLKSLSMQRSILQYAMSGDGPGADDFCVIYLTMMPGRPVLWHISRMVSRKDNFGAVPM
jgi:hypothetical protein